MSENKNRQWLRYFRLVIATDKNNQQAIDLSEFRCKFHISQAVIGKPCTAEITVYNVSKETIDKLGIGTNKIEDSGMKVIIEAGYKDNHGIIFQGDLWWKSTGRESETETFMKLVAATGDKARQYAVVNVSVAKGATQQTIFKKVCEAMKAKGVDVKNASVPFMDTRLPRGKVLFKMATDAMNGIADTNNFDWGYGVDGLVAIPKEPVFNQKETVIVLNADTGLIGRPELDEEGLDVQALLNPKLEIGTLIQIDNASVQRNSYDTTVSEGAYQKNMAVTDDFLSADGIYRVISREHIGDTRGDEWYTSLIVVGVSSASQPSHLLYSHLHRTEKMDSTSNIFDPNKFTDKAINSRMTMVWTALPGIIQSFDPQALTCEVQPAIKGRMTTEKGIELVNMPLLLDCPVVFPHAGGCSLTFPIQPGDECLVVFSSRAIDFWWQLGGIQPPAEARMHDLSDGFVIPGPYSQARKISGVSTSALQIRSDDGTAFIEINPSSHNVKCQTNGDFSVQCKNFAVEASASATITSPAIALNGALTNNASTEAQMTGGLNTTKDVTASGISLKSHTHSNVQNGPGNTGGPQ